MGTGHSAAAARHQSEMGGRDEARGGEELRESLYARAYA